MELPHPGSRRTLRLVRSAERLGGTFARGRTIERAGSGSGGEKLQRARTSRQGSRCSRTLASRDLISRSSTRDGPERNLGDGGLSRVQSRGSPRRPPPCPDRNSFRARCALGCARPGVRIRPPSAMSCSCEPIPGGDGAWTTAQPPARTQRRTPAGNRICRLPRAAACRRRTFRRKRRGKSVAGKTGKGGITGAGFQARCNGQTFRMRVHRAYGCLPGAWLLPGSLDRPASCKPRPAWQKIVLYWD